MEKNKIWADLKITNKNKTFLLCVSTPIIRQVELVIEMVSCFKHSILKNLKKSYKGNKSFQQITEQIFYIFLYRPQQLYFLEIAEY